MKPTFLLLKSFNCLDNLFFNQISSESRNAIKLPLALRKAFLLATPRFSKVFALKYLNLLSLKLLNIFTLLSVDWLS